MNDYKNDPDVLRQRIAELERRVSDQQLLIERLVGMIDSVQQTIGNLIDITNKFILPKK
jgi:uncharacterized coiled-coil protein SlyX